MSKFIRHGPCPKCGSKDNLAIYDPVKRRESYLRNRKRALKRGRERRLELGETLVKYNREWYKANPEKRLLYSAKDRAKRKNLPFNIDISDIKIPEICPVLGIKITFDGGRSDGSPSLDRTKPNLGYVKGNVEVISFRANQLKNSSSLEELKLLVKYMESRNV